MLTRGSEVGNAGFVGCPPAVRLMRADDGRTMQNSIGPRYGPPWQAPQCAQWPAWRLWAPAGASAESTTTPNTAVTANVFGGNAGYARTVVTYDQPANGAVTVDPFGNYTYTPNAGYLGTDSFAVHSTDAVKLYKTSLPPLGTFGGVNISGSAYGSSVAPVPGQPGSVYGLTDRGPNVDGPGGVKVEAIPSFTPAIAKFPAGRRQGGADQVTSR